MIFNYSTKRAASSHHDDDDDNNDDDDDDDLFDSSKKGKSSKKAKLAPKPPPKKKAVNNDDDDDDDDDDGRKKAAAKVDEDDDVEIVQTHAECAKKALDELLAGSSSGKPGAAQEIPIDDDTDEAAQTSKETLARIAKLKGGLEQAPKGVDLSMAASSSSNQRRSSLPMKSAIITFEERQRKQQEKKTEAFDELFNSVFNVPFSSSQAASSSSSKASAVDQGKSIKIKVTINSNHELGFKLFARQPFAEVRSRLAEMTGVSASKIKLQSDAEDIDDNQTAEGLELEDDYTIEMFIPKEEYTNAVQNAKNWKDRPKGAAAVSKESVKPAVAVAEPPKAEPTEIVLQLVFAADIISNDQLKRLPVKVLPNFTLQQLEQRLFEARVQISFKNELKGMSFSKNKTELRLDKTVRELGFVDGTEIDVQARPIAITVSFEDNEFAEFVIKLPWQGLFKKIVKQVEKMKKHSWIFSVDGIDVKSYQYSSPIYALGVEEGTLIKVRK